MRYKVFDFQIENPVLVSTNNMYRHPVRKAKSGRYVSFFTKTQELIDLQEFYKPLLEELITDDKIQEIKENLESEQYDGCELYLSIGFKTGLYIEDISNYIKAIEDCIVKRTGIDDNKNLMVNATKYYTTEENPILYVSMYLTKLGHIDAFINSIKTEPVGKPQDK